MRRQSALHPDGSRILDIDMSGTGIFGLMLEYESELLGRRPVSVSGEAFLSTELQWLDRFLLEEAGGSADRDRGAKPGLEDIGTSAWADYPLALHRKGWLDAAGAERACNRAASFLDWLEERGSPGIYGSGVASLVLKSGMKELRRLKRIHSHLARVLRSRVMIPGPTDDPETFLWEQGLAACQWPEPESVKKDVFVVKSKNRKSLFVYLESAEGREAVVMKADRTLLSLVRPGDLLSLSLGVTKEGVSYLADYGEPMPGPDWRVDVEALAD